MTQFDTSNLILDELDDLRALREGDASHVRVRLAPAAERRIAAQSVGRQPRTALLLGGTGFVGINLLRSLLIDEKIQRVHALVRASDESAAHGRLRETAAHYQVSLPDNDKLVVITGDLLAERMGLDPADHAHLCESVDLVMHAAISGNYRVPYDGHYRDWMRQLLATLHFCAEGRIKHLTYVGSTIARIYAQPDDFTRKDSFWHCGYSRLKWINHAILASLFDSGLPVTLCHAPYLLASSRGGRDPGMRYALWQALRAARHAGVLFRGTMGTCAPVDYACQALVANAFADEPLREIMPNSPHSYGNERLAPLMGVDLVEWPEFRVRMGKLLSGSIGRIYPEDLPRLIELTTLPARVPETLQRDAFPPIAELMPGYLRNVGLLAIEPVATRAEASPTGISAAAG